MALTTKNIETTVFGNKRIVIGEVEASTTADKFDTGLTYIDFVSVVSEQTVGGNSDIQVIRNSNDGTQGTSNGEVWLDVGANGDCQFFAIGN